MPRTRAATPSTRKTLPLAKVYALLEPGPVVLLTTADQPHANIMTLSWQTMLEFEPPQIACVVSNGNHSFQKLQASGECVINIPTADLAEQVVGCGNCSGANVDKFAHFGLTAIPAAQVGAPLIKECYANLECRVIDTRLVSDYCLFILQVVNAWIDPSVQQPQTLHHCGNGEFMLAGERIKLKSKMK